MKKYVMDEEEEKIIFYNENESSRNIFSIRLKVFSAVCARWFFIYLYLLSLSRVRNISVRR